MDGQAGRTDRHYLQTASFMIGLVVYCQNTRLGIYDAGYDGSNKTPFLYEYGYSQGYEVNIQLRPGDG
jgi:hypothetical protein